MTQELIWMIIGLFGILCLGGLYGYWIGTIGKRRSWTGKKVKSVAGFPLMIAGLALMSASIISRRNFSYDSSDPAWTKFPWVILVTAAILAMFVAAKVAYPGVSLQQLDKDDLSIR